MAFLKSKLKYLAYAMVIGLSFAISMPFFFSSNSSVFLYSSTLNDLYCLSYMLNAVFALCFFLIYRKLKKHGLINFENCENIDKIRSE